MKLDSYASYVRAATNRQRWWPRETAVSLRTKSKHTVNLVQPTACRPARHSVSGQSGHLAVHRHRHEFSTMSKLPSWWEDPVSTKGKLPAGWEDSSLTNQQAESKVMDVDQMPDTGEELLSRRIHILGAGSIGTLTAHSLKLLPNPPPVTLILHRQHMLDEFRKRQGIVRLINKDTEIIDDQTGYDVDMANFADDGPVWLYYPDVDAQQKPTFPLQEGELMDTGEVFIYNMIVTVKATATIDALRSVKHRVDSRSTIVLMQNGMGQIDELNEQVFTDPETRPTYMLAIVIHGAHMLGQFQVVHAGKGSVAVGVHRDLDKFPLPPKGKDIASLNLTDEARRKMFPTDEDLYENLSARYLLRTLTRSTALACAAYPYLDLLQLQLEKLATNCVINPLTTVLNFENGGTLAGSPVTRVKRLLLAEISLVMRSLPELQGVPNVPIRFSPGKLEERTDHLALVTAKNSSSMREDMRHARYTEIDFINGYIVKRGDELGIKCVLNYMMMQLVKAQKYAQGQGSPTIRKVVDLQAQQRGSTVFIEDKD